MNVRQSPNLEQAIKRMPKAELHVHLEGAISHGTIEELARRNGVKLEAAEGNLEPRRPRYDHLIDFLDCYRMRSRCLQSPDDFEAASVDVLEHLKAQRVIYAEITIAPTMHRLLNGLTMDDIMPGITAGVRAVCEADEMSVRFIFDIGRQFGQKHAVQTVQEAARHQYDGVVAIGLGGDELHYAPEIFREQFASARKEGLHLVAHAGEVGGSSSIWGAVKSLGAERIGHGIGARGDDELLEYLRVQRIPVEMCPTSNVETGAVRSYSEHPLREYLGRGLMVTVNSDDPAMFGTTLTREYMLCREKFGLEWDEIKVLCLNGVKASFLPDLDKQRLLERFEDELEEIESETGLR
jgi:adenosine deaminase